MLRIVTVLLCLGLLAGCATPREASREYVNHPQQIIVICDPEQAQCILEALKSGGIIQNAPVTVTADVDKKQDASPKVDISPTVDVTP